MGVPSPPGSLTPGMRGTRNTGNGRARGREMPENRNAVIAECPSGHDLTYNDVARGRCPVRGCPTPDLYPGKEAASPDTPETDR